MLKVLADVGTKLLDRLELADLLGKFVVEFRQLALLDAANRAFELRGLACELLRVVLLRERHVDVTRLADLHADELILETRDEAVGTNLKRMIFALAALEGLAVDEPLEVERHKVAFLDFRALGGVDHPAAATTHALDFLVDVLIRDLIDLLFDLDALVLAERDLGLRREACLEDDVLALFQSHDLDVRARNGRHVLLLQGIGKRLVRHGVKRRIENCLLADALLDDAARRLALAKARDAHAVRKILASLRLSLLQDLRFYLYCQHDLVVVHLLCSNLHSMKYPPKCSFIDGFQGTKARTSPLQSHFAILFMIPYSNGKYKHFSHGLFIRCSRFAACKTNESLL